DVALRVASIDAERVQFHQLAAVVFVEARAAQPRGNRNVLAGRLRLPVIEIEQHGGVTGGREQHVFEVSEDMRANRVAFEAGEQRAIRSFPVEYIEVVHPEIDQDLLELPVRVNSAIKLVLDQFAIHKLLRLIRRHRFTAQLGQIREGLKGERSKDLFAFVGIEGIEESQLLLTAPA